MLHNQTQAVGEEDRKDILLCSPQRFPLGRLPNELGDPLCFMHGTQTKGAQFTLYE